ncbi:trace amine-associated receptor 365-like [Lampetra fluviatilis]
MSVGEATPTMDNSSLASSPSCVISFSNLNCTPTSLKSKHDRAVAVFTISLFIVITILSNLLIVSAVALFRQLQTQANALALSLAVSDLLVGVVIMPLSLNKSVYKCWFYAPLLCHVHFFCDYWFTTASVLHLSCIAYDRYVAICDPLRYQQRMNRRALVVMLLFCWLCSALLSTPILLSLSPTLSQGTIAKNGCPDDCRFFISVGILFAIGMWPYFTSVLLVVLMYGRIYRVARGQARKIAAMDRASSGLGGGEEAGRAAASRWASMKREHNAAKTLGAILAAFIISWLPYYIIAIMLTVDESVILPYKVSVWLGYMNSAINPILYATFNKQFRRAFKAILTFNTYPSRAADDEMSSTKN